jgi:hypothetical protein
LLFAPLTESPKKWTINCGTEPLSIDMTALSAPRALYRVLGFNLGPLRVPRRSLLFKRTSLGSILSTSPKPIAKYRFRPVCLLWSSSARGCR